MKKLIIFGIMTQLAASAFGRTDTPPKADQGTVVNWGSTNFGWSSRPPVLMTAIWGGMDFHVGRAADGTIWRWGYEVVPQAITELGACSKASPGSYHIVALRLDETVACWGSNYLGNCDVPLNLGRCIDVAANWECSFAIRSSGQVVGWGPTSGFNLNPPTDLGACAQISASSRSAGVIRQNGTIRVWGDAALHLNRFAGSNYQKLAISGEAFAIALRSDGVVERSGSVAYPPLPSDLGICKDIAAGGFYHAIALRADGTVRTWGFVQTGDEAMPPPAGIRNVLAVAAGRRTWSVLEYICPPDLDWNHSIDAGDIGLLLLDFGTSSADSDLDGSGEVDTGDIGVLLLEFGQCSGQPTAPTPTPLADEPAQKPGTAPKGLR
jgi:alpha-tubulin suppressor-like RCC1 family protein